MYVLKKGHMHVLQCSLSLSLLSISLTLIEICSDEKHFEQHESSLAQLTHKSHTHMHNQVTNKYKVRMWKSRVLE